MELILLPSNFTLAKRSPMVAFLGGNFANDCDIHLAKQLGALVAEHTRLRICVSGYKGKMYADNPLSFHPSFGFSVASGAAAVLNKSEQQIRMITKLSIARQSKADIFEFGEVVEPHGGNEQSRRLSIVSSADVICLAGGRTGTSDYFNFGLALDKPTLPLPFFGGAARKIWGKYHKYLCNYFNIDEPTSSQWLNFQPDILNQEGIAELAERIVVVLAGAVRIRCVVCMPFRDHFEWVYEQIIKPAASAACVDLVRIDLENTVGDISAKFSSEISHADCAIAIVTGQRPNVLYEVGFAHGLRKNVLFLCQRDAHIHPQDVPFYLRNHRTIWYPDRWDDKGILGTSEELTLTLRNLNGNGPYSFDMAG